MKFKVLITIVFFVLVFKAYAIQPIQHIENGNSPESELVNTDSLMHGLFTDTISTSKIAHQNTKAVVNTIENKGIEKPVEPKVAAVKIQPSDTIVPYIIPPKQIQAHVDSLIFLANPFFIEMVYKGLPFDFNWNIQPDLKTLYHGGKATALSGYLLMPVNHQSAEQIVTGLRQYVQEKFIREDADLYSMTYDELPDPEVYKSHFLSGESVKNLRFITDDKEFKHKKLMVKREQLGPWQRKATALLQFSQNYVSPNWYQGGNSNLAILGILTGQLNYDNKKAIQWENSAEWHMGFNSISGDTLRKLSTNDDVFKINSKLGVKAGGNWFYSTSVDFATQFNNHASCFFVSYQV